jgi:hypothetical protein
LRGESVKRLEEERDEIWDPLEDDEYFAEDIF